MKSTRTSKTHNGSGQAQLPSPPKNLEAERAVLGSMLLDAYGVLPDVTAILEAEHFYARAHQIIYEAVLKMAAANAKQIDVITVAEHIDANGQIELIGGRSGLHELLNYSTTSTSAEYYAQIVRQKATSRDAIQLGLELIEAGQEEGDKLQRAIAKTQTALENITAIDPALKIEPYDFEMPQFESKEWQVENILRERDMVLWIGPEKQSKTTLLYQLCVSLASGRDFLGHKIERAHSVAYLDFETEPEDFHYRVERYEKILGEGEYYRMMHNLDVYLLREALLNVDEEPSLRRGTAGYRLLKRLIDSTDSEIIVLDPFQEFATDINEMDNQKVRMALKEMQRLTRGRTCIIVHHLRRADERSDIQIHRNFRRWSDRVRGAQAFKGKADSVFGQQLVEDPQLGPILYLGGFGKRITIDPIPMVDSESTWVWKERLSDVDLEDAKRVLSEKDRELLEAVSKILSEKGALTRNELSDRIPSDLCSRTTIYRKVPRFIQQGHLKEDPDGRLSVGH